MKTLFYFLRGMFESRSRYATYPGDYIVAYNTGRKLTQRLF